jgi:hypothetical protein
MKLTVLWPPLFFAVGVSACADPPVFEAQGTEDSPPPTSTVPPTAPADPCVLGSPCALGSVVGECVQGVCVLGAGRCSRHSDCDDGQVCTVDRCVGGVCDNEPVHDAIAQCLSVDQRPGYCSMGHCEVDATAFRCASEADCPSPTNTCRQHACASERCSLTDRPDGVDCFTAGGAKGTCLRGGCRVQEDSLAATETNCKRTWVRSWGWVRKCRQVSRQRLSTEEIDAQERRIEAAIEKNVRYDMRAVLVSLPSGGYNIVLHNRRARTDLRGLCDPSFVAFTMAGVTRGSNWKSRNMQVWLRPYEEGWQIPTRGSRSAIDAGRRSSELGHLGVVEVSAFRKWLEKEFRPLKASPFDPLALQSATHQFPTVSGPSSSSIARFEVAARTPPSGPSAGPIAEPTVAPTAVPIAMVDQPIVSAPPTLSTFQSVPSTASGRSLPPQKSRRAPNSASKVLPDPNSWDVEDAPSE